MERHCAIIKCSEVERALRARRPVAGQIRLKLLYDCALGESAPPVGLCTQNTSRAINRMPQPGRLERPGSWSGCPGRSEVHPWQQTEECINIMAHEIQ